MLAAARHVELPGTHCLDEVTGGLPNDSADAALLDFHRGSHMHEDGVGMRAKRYATIFFAHVFCFFILFVFM